MKRTLLLILAIALAAHSSLAGNYRSFKVSVYTRIVPQETLDAAKKFFKAHGVEVAGGITYTINERDNFHTYCYNTPEERAMVQHIAEYTAANFDEFILDDFFFTNCKCGNCIEAKGDMPWDEFRLKTMTAAGRDLVIGPAKKVNPTLHPFRLLRPL